MRTQKAIYNIISSFVLQIVTIICGFIVPRLIIETFGSNINGLTTSITQFISYITLLESGVGGVVKAILYKPLAQKDNLQISKILKTTEKFFRKIAMIFIVYLFILGIIFPYLINNEFDPVFTFSMVIVIGISTFTQYYFGISYQILLQADQKQYITSALQIGTVILNAILVVILIKLNCNILVVKLVSAGVYVIRPILLNIIIKRKYKIDLKQKEDKSLLKQRWDGLAHHIAFFLHTNTDVVVITLFLGVKEVSVYSVYYMIVSGIEKITNTFSAGIEAAFGNIMANGEKENLKNKFDLFEFISGTITILLFMSAAILINDFVAIYTNGITDVNYNRPILGYMLLLAEASYCIRLPYHTLVTAAGHFKQTKKSAFLEAGINIVLSIILVNFWGIVGVAVATAIAMIYRTIYYVIYLNKNIIYRKISKFYKKLIEIILVGIESVVTCGLLCNWTANTYMLWVLKACIVVLIISIIIILNNFIFYKKEQKEFIKFIINFINTKKVIINMHN